MPLEAEKNTCMVSGPSVERMFLSCVLFHTLRFILNFLMLENSFQPTPSPLCGLASWPLLVACSMFPGKQFVT